MNIVDIATTAFFTVIAGATVAFVSIYLKEKMDRRKLFKALYSEIKVNNGTAQTIMGLVDEFGSTDVNYPFWDSAFKKIMLSGELYDLPPKVIYSLDSAYSVIHQFNNKEFWRDKGDMCESIAVDLSYLIEELPKYLKFLQIKK